VFSYLYLWTVKPELWPANGTLPWLNIALLLASSAAVAVASRALHNDGLYLALGAAIVLMLGASGLELHAHRGLAPTGSSYTATVQVFVAFNVVTSITVVILALYAMARRYAGLLDAERRNVFDNARLLWHYAVVQNLAGIVLVHGFPKWAQ
jgi:heme/copper-type cytochrome/quinol oxidase subunit 3